MHASVNHLIDIARCRHELGDSVNAVSALTEALKLINSMEYGPGFEEQEITIGALKTLFETA